MSAINVRDTTGNIIGPGSYGYDEALQRMNRRQQKRNRFTNISPADVRREMRRMPKELERQVQP